MGAFVIESALPPLIRKEVLHGENQFPPLPDGIPEVVAADPGWARQWQRTRDAIDGGEGAPERPKDPQRRRNAARYLAMLGHLEFDLIVKGCTYASTRYDMPIAWRACLVKQAHDDMQHASSFITRASRMADEDYWRGLDGVNYKATVAGYTPVLERDLGGFFACVGMHTEGYAAWTNLSGGGAITDKVIGAWALQEIEDEAWHLTFLLPAMREYLHDGTPDEQDRRKRQMVADNQQLIEAMIIPAYRNARDFAVGRLGMDPSVLWGYEHLDRRTRFLFDAIGVQEGYWPDYLRAGDPDGRTVLD